jgi:thiol-disulfide isomerase/thioredoxin
MNENYILMTASWCGPCKVLTSRLAKFNVSVKSVKMEDDPALFKKYNVKHVPTLIKLTEDGHSHITGSEDIFQELNNEQA